MEPLAGHLASNVKQLRDARGMTQQQMAKVSGLPRATWANLESGAANPTLSVLSRVALALQVSLEELTSAPRAACQLYRRGALPVRQQGAAAVRKLLPHAIPGAEAVTWRRPRSAVSELARTLEVWVYCVRSS